MNARIIQRLENDIRKSEDLVSLLHSQYLYLRGLYKIEKDLELEKTLFEEAVLLLQQHREEKKNLKSLNQVGDW